MKEFGSDEVLGKRESRKDKKIGCTKGEESMGEEIQKKAEESCVDTILIPSSNPVCCYSLCSTLTDTTIW